MGSLTRESLKKAFRNGSLPTGEDFGRLIDAFVHVDEFAKWKIQSSIELGALRKRRWSLSCNDTGELLMSPVQQKEDATPAGADSQAGNCGTQFRIDGWVAMEKRRGAYRERGSAAEDRRPVEGDAAPLPHVSADGEWHQILTATDCSAYEVVAQAATPRDRKRPGLGTQIARTFGIATPTAVIVHGIAVAAGRGAPPAVTATSAPQRSGRWILAGLAAGAVLLSMLLAIYASFQVPVSRCPVPWGVSCLPVVFQMQRALMIASTLMLLIATGMVVALWVSRNACLHMAWHPTKDGNAHVLELRAPASVGAEIFYHVTRLW